MTLSLDLLDNGSYEVPNWAEHLDEETLRDLGHQVCESQNVDAQSREPWLAETEMWLDMASQVIETKNTPWVGASSVKFPLLTTAALQFHARAHQELLKGERLVKGKVIGKDNEAGDKAARAKRVESAMSNQLMYEMEDWSDDTDRLLYVLPLVGTVFRKTYWSALLRRPASELVLASDLVVNYYATDWERARKTHSFLKDKNEVEEQKRLGNYLRLDLPQEAPEPQQDDLSLDETREPVALPDDVPYLIFEQHGWYDLDEDGYSEPYIVTVESGTEKVLRISPRFLPKNIDMVDDEILRISPLEYIVAYKFLPDVESPLYGVGLGKLLGPSNAAIDTIINQLIDTGTLSTMPSGFIGRGVRLSRGGRIRLQPGEWQVVNSSGEDLQRNFFPMPTKEPSSTLFQLLGMLIQAGEKMGSVTEALSGENPGQNQPFSTTSAVMEQGMQVFLGIYKRVYRSLTKEFRMLFLLNAMNLGEDSYNNLLDDEKGPFNPMEDFSPEGLDIVPEADPSLANSMRKRQRVEALIKARQAGIPLNDQYIARIFLEAIDEPEPQEALRQEPPPPSADQIKMQMHEKEMALKEKELQLRAMSMQHEPMKDLAKAMESYAKAKALGGEVEIKQMKMAMDAMNERNTQDMQNQKLFADIIQGQQKVEIEREKARNPNSGQPTG